MHPGPTDLRPGKMHMYTAEDANALEIKYVSKKEHLVGRLKMVMAQSGHLMLPCSQFQTPSSSPSRRTNQPSSSTTYPFNITYAYCIEPSCYFQESTNVTREADRAGRPHERRMRKAFRVRRQPSLQFNCEWGGSLSDNQEGKRKCSLCCHQWATRTG